ncbi:MAG: hypothetical protein IIZ47_01345, partial [Erysipelotrichaceae bacterium]|nr:hypothetical protein [Erysipelotrichaceae bacterium]
MKKLICVLLILGVLLSGCSKKKTVDPIDDNYRVFYEIFVGSFSDSNGDGIGDLQGIINRLDYLNDGNVNSDKSLGIQGIWLTPIFASPSYHKYDAKDYYEIDPQFGTMDDLKKLVEECHKRNVLVILDLAINHSSDRNEWYLNFMRAHQKGDTSDPYYDWYSWSGKDDIPSGKTYRRITNTDQYYECNFSGDMPEFNYDNFAVREQMVDLAKFYLDLGVDGFRFDAAKYIYYGDNPKSINFWNWYLGKLKEMKADIYTVGEVWSSDAEVIPYVKYLNCFDFSMSMAEGYVASAAKSGNINVYTNYVEQYLKKIHDQNPDAMMIPFVANHDMDRAAGFLTCLNKQAYMAANIYLLCSGSPFLYYGEEIGMKGTRGAANTDANRRLAMLWGDEDTVKDPEGTTFDASKQVNGTVKDQLANPDSLYHYYRKVIDFRNRYPQIARGDYKMYYLKDSTMGGFTISYEGEDSYLFHNASAV